MSDYDIDRQYEKFLGIRTDDEEVIFGRQNMKYSVYEASEYEGLIKIFDEVPLETTDTMVDIGCGMGRVLFYCHQRFMCNVVGIEYDDEIFDRLEANTDYYKARFRSEHTGEIKLLHMKAEDYQIGASDNVFYLFNPFSSEVLEKIMTGIVVSARLYPRQIKVIMYYCTYEAMAVMRNLPFTLERIIKLPAYRFDPDEKAYIYTL